MPEVNFPLILRENPGNFQSSGKLIAIYKNIKSLGKYRKYEGCLHTLELAFLLYSRKIERMSEKNRFTIFEKNADNYSNFWNVCIKEI